MAESNQNLKDKIETTEIINKLFVYTDNRQWDLLKTMVFTSEVNFDMTSMGAEKASRLNAETICRLWDQGFNGLDSIHHQAGNYIIEIHINKTTVIAYPIASHYKSVATKGTTRTFVGSYDLHLLKLKEGWRIDGFKYNLKYSEGNLSLD